MELVIIDYEYHFHQQNSRRMMISSELLDVSLRRKSVRVRVASNVVRLNLPVSPVYPLRLIMDKIQPQNQALQQYMVQAECWSCALRPVPAL